VELEELHLLERVAARRDFNSAVPWHDCFAAAAFGRADRTCVVDEYLPHDARHERQKVSAIRDAALSGFCELDEGLVD